MIKYYKTDDQLIREEPKIEDGVWVQMVDPTAEECAMIADVLNVDIGDVQAALDEEESSRIELEDGYTLILVDIPAIEIRHGKESYTTIPLGIILTRDVIVTVCTGHADTPQLCRKPRQGVQHQEKNAFCIPDSVPHFSHLPE